jgi:hypothetical protein
MQDIGGNEDTERSKEDISFGWQELSVESLGHCQSIGNHGGSSVCAAGGVPVACGRYGIAWQTVPLSG